MPVTVILSPHPDDAILSCWRVLTSPDDVAVVNVFAGAPPAGTPPGWWDHRLGAPHVAAPTRIEEDRRALARAGRSAQNLDFLDAQYRKAPQPLEPLLDAVRAAVPSGATVYAPASLGRHRDHDAVRAAALALRDEAGVELVLYADLPHASARGWPPSVVGAAGDARVAQAWAQELSGCGVDNGSATLAGGRLASDAHARKIEAVREYQSQLQALEATFGRRMDDPDLLRYEVEWRLLSSSASAPARKRADSS